MKTEWVHKKLGELGSVNPNNREPIPDHFIYIDLESVVSGQLLAENLISKKEAPSRAQRIVYLNDVLYQTVRPYQNNNYIHKKRGDYIASTGYALIRCYEDYDPDFVYYLLHTQHFESVVLGLCTGTSYPAIAPNSLKRIEVAVPSTLPAQRHIAAILSSADKVIAATQKVIAKYKQMKQGMMEDLLKPKEGWEMVRLGECCEINPKTDTTKVQDYDVVAFIRMEDVSNDGFITSFSERAYKSLQKKGFTVFQNDDVIFAKITPCMENGKGGLVRNMKSKICMGSTEFHVLRACANVSIDFIYQLTISKRFRQKAEMQMTGSAGQQRVPAAFLEDYFISIPFKNGVPDLAEQRRIAAILSGIDAKIAAEEKVLEKYGKIKKGLMERMLEEKV